MDINPELETFRQQWRAEVTARSQNLKSITSPDSHSRNSRQGSSAFTTGGAPLALTEADVPQSSVVNKDADADDEDAAVGAFHDLRNKEMSLRLGDGSESRINLAASEKEPTSALEHYERAVEKETQGVLGDSLKHYRQAFRVCLS